MFLLSYILRMMYLNPLFTGIVGVNISVGPLSENIKVWRSHLPTLPYLFIFYSCLLSTKRSTLTATTYSINIPSYPDLCLIFAFFLFDANYVYHISHINTHTYVQVPFCYVSYYNEVKRWCGLAMAFLNWTSMFYFFNKSTWWETQKHETNIHSCLIQERTWNSYITKTCGHQPADIQLQ